MYFLIHVLLSNESSNSIFDYFYEVEKVKYNNSGVLVVNTLINILLISLYVFCVCYIIMLGLSVCYIIMLGLSVLTVVGVTFLYVSDDENPGERAS